MKRTEKIEKLKKTMDDMEKKYEKIANLPDFETVGYRRFDNRDYKKAAFRAYLKSEEEYLNAVEKEEK